MSRLFWTAVGLVLATSGGAVAPALAGAQSVSSSFVLNGRPLALSRIEQDRLGELRSLLQSANRGAQDRALTAAEAVANSPDAIHVLALYQLEIGRQRQDDALRARALDVLIASGDTPADRLPGYLGARGDIAFRNRDYPAASSSWTRLAELQPNDPQAMVNLAQVRHAQDDSQGAVDLIQRAIALREGTSQPVPEGWYRQWVSIAYNGRLVDEGAAAAHGLVSAYPTPDNWRFALVAFRQLAPPQAAARAEIDLFRLMRAARVLARAAEYQRFSQLLARAGLLVEARAVLEEGISRDVVSRSESPTPEILRELDRGGPQPGDRLDPSSTDSADALIGPGLFEEAVALYRAALQQAGPHDAVVNTRLATALALSGRRDDADTAFRAVIASPADGPVPRWYAELARFWLAWLAQPRSDSSAAVTR